MQQLGWNWICGKLKDKKSRDYCDVNSFEMRRFCFNTENAKEGFWNSGYLKNVFEKFRFQHGLV